MKRLTIYEPVEFSDESYTERGEKVYKTLKLDCRPFGVNYTVSRVIRCETGIGITEEWIEDTVKGCLEALKKDYPADIFEVKRIAPNHIRFECTGRKLN